MGSKRSDRSVVSIVGSRFSPPCASGMIASASLATHWWAPAGLLESSHSFPKRISKKSLPNRVGVVVQVTSRPLVIASGPAPVLKEFFHPRPCCSIGAPSGSASTWSSGFAAPCVLPKECPPAISATVSSSFIAMRANVSRMSRAAASGSGLTIGALGVDVDQAHLDGGQRLLQVALAGVALVAEPLGLGTPVDVVVGLPHVGASAGEAERREAHRLQGHVAGEDHQVRPRDALAVLPA